MAYNLPTNATNNISGLLSLVQYVQEVSDGWFMVMLNWTIFIIMFIILKGYSAARAFAGAAFFHMILCVISRTLGLIDNKWMYLSIILVAVGAVWLHVENSSGNI